MWIIPILLVAAVAVQADDQTVKKKHYSDSPIKGYNTWYGLGCSDKFNIQSLEGIRDAMISKGLKAAGYNFLNIDDCWMASNRNSTGQFVINTDRFPNGLKGFVADLHDKGFRFGIYSSAGSKTCAGYPASLHHELDDALFFYDLGVDLLKYDNCNDEGVDLKLRYRTMADALLKAQQQTTTGDRNRVIFYSMCEWGTSFPASWAAEIAHQWRTTGDITNNWGSIYSNAIANDASVKFSGKDAVNDPDMLMIGAPNGVNWDEERTQFLLWSIIRAPLLLSWDVRDFTAQQVNLLLNKDVLTIHEHNQKQAARKNLASNIDIWRTSEVSESDEFGVLLFVNTGDKDLDLTSAKASVEVGDFFKTGLNSVNEIAVPDDVDHTYTWTKDGDKIVLNGNLKAHASILFKFSRAAEHSLIQ